MLELFLLDAPMDISDHSLSAMHTADQIMIILLDSVTKDAQAVIPIWDSIVTDGGGHMPEEKIFTFQDH
jgi:hypothetical protein